MAEVPKVEESCQTCRFRRLMPVQEGTRTIYAEKNGICHRFPGGGPHVAPTDWCGEYKLLPVYKGK